MLNEDVFTKWMWLPAEFLYSVTRLEVPSRVSAMCSSEPISTTSLLWPLPVDSSAWAPFVALTAKLLTSLWTEVRRSFLSGMTSLCLLLLCHRSSYSGLGVTSLNIFISACDLPPHWNSNHLWTQAGKDHKIPFQCCSRLKDPHLKSFFYVAERWHRG